MCMNVKEFLQAPNWAIRLSKLAFAPRKMIENNIIFQTPFLPQSSTIKQRAWHIVNDVTIAPTCKICGNSVKFQKTNKYATYCSVKCSRKSPEVHNKKLRTEIAKHGSVEAFRLNKAKVFKEISMELYGVENIAQSEYIKSRIQKKRG